MQVMDIKSLADFSKNIKLLDRAAFDDKYQVFMNKAYNDNSHRAIVNVNTGKLVTVCSDQYKIVQHEEAFEPLKDSLHSLNLSVFGRLYNYNDKAVAEIVFKDDGKFKIDGQDIKMGFRMANSYDLKGAITGQLFAYRRICSNGMILGKVFKDVKLWNLHLGTIQRVVKERIENWLKACIKSDTALKLYISEAMKDSFEWKLSEKILKEKLLFNSMHYNRLMKYIEVKEGERLTRWDLYNAITEYATHGEKITDAIKVRLQEKAQDVLALKTVEIMSRGK